MVLPSLPSSAARLDVGASVVHGPVPVVFDQDTLSAAMSAFETSFDLAVGSWSLPSTCTALIVSVLACASPVAVDFKVSSDKIVRATPHPTEPSLEEFTTSDQVHSLYQPQPLLAGILADVARLEAETRTGQELPRSLASEWFLAALAIVALTAADLFDEPDAASAVVRSALRTPQRAYATLPTLPAAMAPFAFEAPSTFAVRQLDRVVPDALRPLWERSSVRTKRLMLEPPDPTMAKGTLEVLLDAPTLRKVRTFTSDLAEIFSR